MKMGSVSNRWSTQNAQAEIRGGGSSSVKGRVLGNQVFHSCRQLDERIETMSGARGWLA